MSEQFFERLRERAWLKLRQGKDLGKYNEAIKKLAIGPANGVNATIEALKEMIVEKEIKIHEKIITCLRCGKRREIFSNGTNVGYDGPLCKGCYSTAYYQKNKEHLEEYNREWYQRNIDRQRKVGRERKRRDRAKKKAERLAAQSKP